ncbi:hypothetical protein [Aliidiomarina celeris]|uniref:hypothetical protein n=1 Tax=Aliidiomarina celeris TaxID=2249428 RepID=UPI000DE8E08A|nr:hypothetical protein [Aliidiomarina celeris]
MTSTLTLALLLLGDSYLATPSEQVDILAEHAVFPAEGKQHQQLALSLRNQRLLEQQAESRARQLQHQLLAAQALHAMRQMSVVVATTDLNSEEENNAPGEMTVQVDLHRFRLLALFFREGRWIARLGYGDHIVAARSGDIILGDVEVVVEPTRVVLASHNSRHTLSLGIY